MVLLYTPYGWVFSLESISYGVEGNSQTGYPIKLPFFRAPLQFGSFSCDVEMSRVGKLVNSDLCTLKNL